jgi:ketosteroid isomerase-like protein
VFEANLETLRRALDAYNRRDRAGFLRYVDPDVENVPPQVWPDQTPVHGRESLWDWYVEGGDVWGEGDLDIRSAKEAGEDRIVAEVAGEVQGQASGAPVKWSFWPVVTFRDGVVVQLTWFADGVEALAAAGVRTPD